jgi:hypothetical protein
MFLKKIKLLRGVALYSSRYCTCMLNLFLSAHYVTSGNARYRVEEYDTIQNVIHNFTL